jgi:hypothetical protein
MEDLNSATLFLFLSNLIKNGLPPVSPQLIIPESAVTLVKKAVPVPNDFSYNLK